MQLFINAEESGVDVNIMMSGKHIDKKIAGDEAFESLLEAGVNLWYYQKTMLHSKVITVDNIVSCVGSANFNHRSMMKDDEVNMVIIDEELTGLINTHFETDLEYCKNVDKGRWNGRSAWKKTLEKLTNFVKQEI